MLRTFLMFTYSINSIFLTLFIIYGKVFVFKKQDAIFVSNFCALIALLLTLYVILSFLYAIIEPALISKLIMILFGLTPFLIGRIATYNSEKYFTTLQVCFILISTWYLWE